MSNDDKHESVYHHQNDNQPTSTPNNEESVSEESLDKYWHFNLWLLFQLLVVWFVVSFGCGIFFVDWLDQFQFFGFPLGFWFAQQGSIYTFVILIGIYTWQMKRLERRFGVSDDDPVPPTTHNNDSGNTQEKES